MTNIILCGGSGTRLWPLSRELMPKQFIKLFDANLGANSLLMQDDSKNSNNLRTKNSTILALNSLNSNSTNSVLSSANSSLANSALNFTTSSPNALNSKALNDFSTTNSAQTQQEKFTQKGYEKSLFHLCLQRNALLCENFLVVSNEEHYFLALDQIGELEGLNFSINEGGGLMPLKTKLQKMKRANTQAQNQKAT